MAIVSNNSSPAGSAYLAAHDLGGYVHAVSAGTTPDPAKLKPEPYLVRQAIQALTADAAECVVIGDSVSDVIAAHAARIKAIGYTNKPGKVDQLRSAGADAVTDSMTAIAQAADPRRSGRPLLRASTRSARPCGAPSAKVSKTTRSMGQAAPAPADDSWSGGSGRQRVLGGASILTIGQDSCGGVRCYRCSATLHMGRLAERFLIARLTPRPAAPSPPGR